MADVLYVLLAPVEDGQRGRVGVDSGEDKRAAAGIVAAVIERLPVVWERCAALVYGVALKPTDDGVDYEVDAERTTALRTAEGAGR